MSRKYAKFVVCVSLCMGLPCFAQETFNACLSALTLPFSRPFLTLTDGHEFTFHQIGADQCGEAAAATFVQTQFDQAGQLVAFHDGRIKPLVLGSMPRKVEYITQLRQGLNVEPDARVAVYSLNRPFELGWKGVPGMIEQEQHVDLFLHPTTDECAPSLIDTLRAVDKLRKRDQSAHALSYVQCLAGHGRSATLVCAYIYSLLEGHCDLPMPDVVERYLKSKRPVVNLSFLQKEFLNDFRQRLQTRTFEQLCDDHAQEIEDADQALAYEQMSPTIKQQGTEYGRFVWGTAATTSVVVGIALHRLLKAYRK